jgi:hypothetical protein
MLIFGKIVVDLILWWFDGNFSSVTAASQISFEIEEFIF